MPGKLCMPYQIYKKVNNHVLFKNDKIYVYYAFVNITQCISHCFNSFTEGVVIKFLLISSIEQPYGPLIAFIVVMGPQSACFND